MVDSRKERAGKKDKNGRHNYYNNSGTCKQGKTNRGVILIGEFFPPNFSIVLVRIFSMLHTSYVLVLFFKCVAFTRTWLCRLILIGEHFIQSFRKFENDRRYVSIYGGVLSLFAKFFTIRLILIGECFFCNFQSLEIIGDMYQYTEAFFHYPWNSPEPKKNQDR